MRPFSLRKAAAIVAATLVVGNTTQAEDIDLFTTPSGNVAAPNILIVLDNSSNWNRNDQAWPTGKQGESELRALYNLMNDVSIGTNVNMGLMMMSSSNNPEDSAYVRFHIRNMDPVAKAALKEMVGTAACTNSNNSLTGKKNCILADFNKSSGAAGAATNNNGEQTSAASTRYSGAMFEIFKYFGGYTDPPRANLNQAGSPVDNTHFGPAHFSTRDLKFDPAAYSGGNYVSPITINNSCAKNYVIFIANGFPSQDSNPDYLKGINGDPAFPVPIGGGNNVNRAANWARYLFTTDVSEQLGKQSVNTYTINVFNAKEEKDQTALLKAMAKFGGGRYFEAKNEDAILKALREIVVEIQSVNSVFASASLPINATNRSQNENQVFIGMFRPDAKARPMWYGNLKHFQIALFGKEAKLADKDGQQAIAASTGFIQACATSFWTTDSGQYWDWSADSAGICTTVANSAFSDLPDGGVVEKGGVAEMLRRGNQVGTSAPFSVNRQIYTCAAGCGSMVDFTTGNVTQARVGAADATEHKNIINFTRGQDVNNENQASADASAATVDEPRPTIHGDIAHSRPLPVNYGGTTGVVVYYGSNEGTFKAVEGKTGRELWSFVAPEHHGKLKRLYQNTPLINYPGAGIVGGQPKDYFFDGAAGLYQNLDNSKIWIFPTMRRGGRMMYGFDVTSPTNPVLLWAKGCPSEGTNSGCSGGFSDIGQTWSTASVGFIKGHSATDPVVIVGGGYDTCLDTDVAVTTCTGSASGRRVYILNAKDGSIIRDFQTDAPVPADVTLIDRNFDAGVDAIYIADALGGLYRIDVSSPDDLVLPLAPGSWKITKIAETKTGNRKFLFGPAAVAIGSKVYLAVGSGDRERPLDKNYPYLTPIKNRFYMFIDDFTGSVIDLDGTAMDNFTSVTDCSSVIAAGKRGWFMDLEAGRGEQTVTSAVIFGGTVFFSTNRPTAAVPGSCGTNLGEARGYAVNLLNAAGVIGSAQLCGGERSGVFTGGGIPPSPVVGIVPVKLPGGQVKPVNVLIGGINLDTGTGSPIGAQEPKVPIQRIRTRVYWYPHGDR